MKKFSVLAVATVLLFACSHVKGNFRNVEGKAYDLERMEQVQTGMTIDEVTSLVGPPLEVTEEGGTVLHRYFMVREKIDKDKTMWVFSVEKKTTETHEVILTYENSILMSKHIRFSVDKPEEKKEEEAP